MREEESIREMEVMKIVSWTMTKMTVKTLLRAMIVKRVMKKKKEMMVKYWRMRCLDLCRVWEY